jgi:hypothetical protein
MLLDFSVVDGPNGTTPSFAPPSGVKSVVADLDGMPVVSGQMIDLYTLALGDHTLTVVAADYYGNISTQSVTFQIGTSLNSLMSGVTRLYQEGKIDNKGIYNSFMVKLNQAQKASGMRNALNAFINEVRAQSGKHIDAIYANALIEDALYLIAH